MVRLPLPPALAAVSTVAGLAFTHRHRLRALSLRLAVEPVVQGLDQVAELPGPFIFVANHPSALDAPLIRDALADHFPHCVTVSAKPPTGLHRVVERLFGLRSTKQLSGLLRGGVSLILFPESVGSDDGTLTRFNGGAARLAIQTGIPIVPVALLGTFGALPPWRVLPAAGRPRVTVVFGRPIHTVTGDQPDEITDRIVRSISVGLAQESYGWYGALRADADSVLVRSGTNAASEARWRRIWKATSPPRNRSHQRVWV